MKDIEDFDTPLAPCLCGGRYSIHYKNGTPILIHTSPHCERFERIETVQEAIDFSQANRGVS